MALEGYANTYTHFLPEKKPYYYCCFLKLRLLLVPLKPSSIGAFADSLLQAASALYPV